MMSARHWSITEQLNTFGPDAPRSAITPDQARRYCRRLARDHYENFLVASWLLPRRLRQHVANLYAYCRWADDLADELANPSQSLVLLDWWERQLTACYAGSAEHPVFVALRETIREFAIPEEPLRDLLVAFRRDQQPTDYRTWEDVLDYCRYSANPVGRLVLQLAGCRHAETEAWSDSICTGLQVANFCQDAAVDAQRGRIYFPRDELEQLACSRREWLQPHASVAKRRFLSLQVDRAEACLFAGLPLIDEVPSWLRVDLRMFLAGGRAILDRIRRANHDVWTQRPTVGKGTQFKLLARAWSEGHRPVAATSQGYDPRMLAASYGLCRQLAQWSASSFRWSFLALPRERRDAMYALYAFLRRTDDLVDDEVGLEQTRAALVHWKAMLAETLAGNQRGGIWPAVHDMIERHHVPPQYLFDAIDGAAMDLDLLRYETFDQLAEYCHRVASVVGLSCLRIWGCSDARAIEPARKCGMAFQLTNILRDLQEDALRGRVYLPLEDLRRFGYSVEELLQGVSNGPFQALMAWQIERAERYYHDSHALIPYLNVPARRVFATMINTYRSMLSQIKQSPAQVFAGRHVIRPGKLRLAWIAGQAWWSAGGTTG